MGKHLVALPESPFVRYWSEIHGLEATASCRNAVFDVSKLEIMIIISQPH